jgi:nitrilase
MKNLLKIAVIQDAPVLFDLAKTMEKTIRLTREAAEMGAKLIVFPESFIPCYPRGLTFGMVVGSRTQAGREDFMRYYQNSVAVPERKSIRWRTVKGTGRFFIDWCNREKWNGSMARSL